MLLLWLAPSLDSRYMDTCAELNYKASLKLSSECSLAIGAINRWH